MANESQNSSTPPSSDGFTRNGKTRAASTRATGGHGGHSGHTLAVVETPDEVVIHCPSQCEACQSDLGGGEGRIKERRHVQELPVMHVVGRAHHVDVLTGSVCPHQHARPFPNDVPAPAQDGPGVQALAVSFSPEQRLPMERMGEVCEDLCSCRFSEGTLWTWRQETARTRGPTIQQITQVLLAHTLGHVDDTGGRVTGVLHWCHVTARHG